MKRRLALLSLVLLAGCSRTIVCMEICHNGSCAVHLACAGPYTNGCIDCSDGFFCGTLTAREAACIQSYEKARVQIPPAAYDF